MILFYNTYYLCGIRACKLNPRDKRLVSNTTCVDIKSAIDPYTFFLRYTFERASRVYRF